MRTALFFLLLILGTSKTYSQAHSFAALQGSIESGSVNYSGLNEALSRYNDEHGTDLGKLNVATGFDAAFSRIWDDNGIYAGLRFKRLETKSSSSNDQGDIDLTARLGALTIESGFSLIQNDHMEIQIGFGADWRLETVRFDRDGESTDAMSEYNGSISPHFQGYLFLSRKIPLAAFGRVYYEWAFTETDYSRVYNQLNESVLSNKVEGMSSRANAFAFSLGLAIIFHERDHSFTRD